MWRPCGAPCAGPGRGVTGRPLGQWHGVRNGSVDRNRGHRRSGRRCARGRSGAVPPAPDQAVGRQTLPHPSTDPADTPPRRASRSHNRALRPSRAAGHAGAHRHHRPARRRRRRHHPAGRAEAAHRRRHAARADRRPPSLRSAPNRPQPPEPCARAGPRAGTPSRPTEPVAPDVDAIAPAGRPAGAAARPAREIAERARPQHAGPARRWRSRRGLLGGRRGHPADRRPRPRRHRVGGHRAARAAGQQHACAPRPTPARCCATC